MFKIIKFFIDDNSCVKVIPYTELARTLTETFGFKKVAFTLRESISASVNGWSGLLYTKDHTFLSKNIPSSSLTASAAATPLPPA